MAEFVPVIFRPGLENQASDQEKLTLAAFNEAIQMEGITTPIASWLLQNKGFLGIPYSLKTAAINTLHLYYDIPPGPEYFLGEGLAREADVDAVMFYDRFGIKPQLVLGEYETMDWVSVLKSLEYRSLGEPKGIRFAQFATAAKSTVLSLKADQLMKAADIEVARIRDMSRNAWEIYVLGSDISREAKAAAIIQEETAWVEKIRSFASYLSDFRLPSDRVPELFQLFQNFKSTQLLDQNSDLVDKSVFKQPGVIPNINRLLVNRD